MWIVIRDRRATDADWFTSRAAIKPEHRASAPGRAARLARRSASECPWHSWLFSCWHRMATNDGKPSRPRKDMTQQHFRGVAHSRSRRTLRVAGAAQPASRLIVPQRNAAHIRLMVKWAGVDFRRLLRSRFAGLGNRAQVATCSWLRGSGGSSVQSSSAVSDGCSPSSSLSVNSTSVSPICDHGRAMQAGRARCTKAASGRAYDTIVAIRGWRP